MKKSNILDLRSRRASSSHSTNWLAGWMLAIILLASGCAYLAWLDNGCALNGVMTWHGKECIN